jgi:hypothetical protein
MGDVIVTSRANEPTIRTCRCAIRVADISDRVGNLTFDYLVDDNSAHQEALTPQAQIPDKAHQATPPRLVLPRRSGKTPTSAAAWDPHPGKQHNQSRTSNYSAKQSVYA